MTLPDMKWTREMPDEEFDLIGNVEIAEPILGMQIGAGVLQTHPHTQCVGETCCIHNPSRHPLREAPLNWRADRHLMERICPHGIGHPDPDDLAFKLRALGQARYDQYAWESHGCDGCCT